MSDSMRSDRPTASPLRELLTYAERCLDAVRAVGKSPWSRDAANRDAQTLLVPGTVADALFKAAYNAPEAADVEDMLDRARSALSSEAAPRPKPIPLENLIAEIILRVSELPDRTSPDDQPDMMLVTAEELEDIINGAWEDAGVVNCAWCTGLLARATTEGNDPSQEAMEHYEISGHFSGCPAVAGRAAPDAPPDTGSVEAKLFQMESDIAFWKRKARLYREDAQRFHDEANALRDPFVLIGMENRDDAEAHEAMLTVDLGAWLVENPNEYPFSTSKLAEKLVRIGWRASRGGDT